MVKKFGDDQAGNLVALLAYFAFLATFPLLLALTAILGIVLRSSPDLQQRLVDSAFSEFPIVGTQLHSQLGVAALGNSGLSLTIGIVGALLGSRGFANAVQTTLNTLWAVPKVDRPGFPVNYLRTFSVLAVLGLGVGLTAAAAALAGASGTIGLSGTSAYLLTFVLSAAVYCGLFLAVFRLATAGTVPTRALVGGAVVSGIAWQILLSTATVIVSHFLAHAQAIAGLFGVVLGLMAWFGLQASVTVYAIEADVVRVRHLWPRSITQPPLTEADKNYLIAVTDTETRRPEQQVTTGFSPEADRPPAE